MQNAVEMIADSDQIAALAHPVRSRILEALRTPETAAGLARSFGRSRQSLGYHLKELERIGLIRHAGERRKGNFLEQLYQATARRFVVSSRFASNPEQLASVFRDQVSLSQLVNLGERLQCDAANLIEQSAHDGGQLSTASVEAEVRLPDAESREEFMREFVDLLKTLLAKYGDGEGQRYRVAFATYPQSEHES
jgi:DNA-binding transcriptional ArsR family regulator